MGWGERCDHLLTNFWSTSVHRWLCSGCQWPQGLDSAALRVFIGFHVPKSPLLQSCTAALACQAATSTCSSFPSLPGAFSFVLLSLCLITLYLHLSPCTPPFKYSSGKMILPPGIPASFSLPIVLYGCIFFSEPFIPELLFSLCFSSHSS